MELKADIFLQLMMETSAPGVTSEPARLKRKRWQMSLEVGHCWCIRLTSQHFWVTHGLFYFAFLFQNTSVLWFLLPLFPFPSLLRTRSDSVQNGVPREHLGRTHRRTCFKPPCLIASLIIHILLVFDNYLTGRAREHRLGHPHASPGFIFSRRDEQVSLEIRLMCGEVTGAQRPQKHSRSH